MFGGHTEEAYHNPVMVIGSDGGLSSSTTVQVAGGADDDDDDADLENVPSSVDRRRSLQSIGTPGHMVVFGTVFNYGVCNTFQSLFLEGLLLLREDHDTSTHSIWR